MTVKVLFELQRLADLAFVKLRGKSSYETKNTANMEKM